MASKRQAIKAKSKAAQRRKMSTIAIASDVPADAPAESPPRRPVRSRSISYDKVYERPRYSPIAEAVSAVMRNYTAVRVDGKIKLRRTRTTGYYLFTPYRRTLLQR